MKDLYCHAYLNERSISYSDTDLSEQDLKRALVYSMNEITSEMIKLLVKGNNHITITITQKEE
jgi:hypothetical protein